MHMMLQKNWFTSLNKKLDTKLPWWLAGALLLLIVLRIPNLFEPYWYGDEAIYLTIGNALNNGAKLYADIVDHKTPLIYYFARMPDQLSFRILFLAWMVMTTLAFSKLTQFLFKSRLSVQVSTILFVIATTLPWFEGNIPNGELFVMGFFLLGLVALIHTTLAHSFFHETHTTSLRTDWPWLVVSGALFGCAVLTKVPAVFDLAAVAIFFLLTLLAVKKFAWKKMVNVIGAGIILLFGFLIPILISIAYFVRIGAGQAYLNFGLLYNFHYSGTWILHFSSPVLSFLYTFAGKGLILGIGILSVLLLRKYIPRSVQFLLSWTLLALFACLLSNRPYPHYFMQVFPPLILLLASLFEWKRYVVRERISTILYTAISLFLFFGVLITLHAGLYPTVSYYTNFWRLVTKQQTYAQYRNSFNSLMADNYAALHYLGPSRDKKLFIWGTNPTLYALVKKQPVGKFTVSFHIKDLNAYEETIQALNAYKPEYIVVMHDENTALPGLDQLLRSNYIPFEEYDHFTLWRKSHLSAL